MKNRVINWRDVVTFLLFPWMIWVSVTLVKLQVGTALINQKLNITPQDFEAFERRRTEGPPAMLADPEIISMPRMEK